MTAELEQGIYLKTVIFAAVIAGAAILFDRMAVAAGLALGTLASMVNFKLLAIRTHAVISTRKSYNPFFFIVNKLARFAIMGAVLWFTANEGVEMFVGASIGLFTVTVTVYADHLLWPK
jgi:hypothetical protein